MTPDKDACRGAMSRPALILTIQSSWAEAQPEIAARAQGAERIPLP